MKIMAFDIGDQWVGVAVSDGLGITCKPLETVVRDQLDTFLSTALAQHNIGKVVIGNPLTMSGKESDQTKKVIAEKERLELLFNQVNGRQITWVMWDERLSSKRATQVQVDSGIALSAASKRKQHSIAAAFILQAYLDFLAFQNA